MQPGREEWPQNFVMWLRSGYGRWAFDAWRGWQVVPTSTLSQPNRFLASRLDPISVTCSGSRRWSGWRGMQPVDLAMLRLSRLRVTEIREFLRFLRPPWPQASLSKQVPKPGWRQNGHRDRSPSGRVSLKNPSPLPCSGSVFWRCLPGRPVKGPCRAGGSARVLMPNRCSAFPPPDGRWV